MQRDVSPELRYFDEMRLRPFKEKLEYSLSLISKVVSSHKRYCVSCSFGKDSTVLLHLVRQLDPNVVVVFSNTGVEMPETLKFRDYLVKEWNLNYIELKPKKTFWECVKEYGYPSHRFLTKEKRTLIRNKKVRNRGTPACCYYLKEKPAIDFYRRAGMEATFLGLRHDESYSRRWHIIRRGDYYYSKSKRVFVVLPLAYWTEEEIWRYISENNLPVNESYKKTSRVGCIVCTSYKGWEKDMARYYPALYRKIATELGRPPLDNFLKYRV